MFFDIIGWIGSGMVVLAYLLLSTKKITTGFTYQILNLLAALFMAIGLFPKDAWFSFALQIVWGIIALASILSLLPRKNTRKK